VENQQPGADDTRSPTPQISCSDL